MTSNIQSPTQNNQSTSVMYNNRRKSLNQIMNNYNDTYDRTPWQDETDSGYCHEIARRCVARAALNLGIDAMSGDALDGMGDVLISYLERVSILP